MKIRIVGSGGWEGIPKAYNYHQADKEAIKNPEGKDRRTRPQLVVENKKGTFAIEISPDIGIQFAKHSITGVREFLVSHHHHDHMGGIAELHAYFEFANRNLKKPYQRKQPQDKIYGSKKTIAMIKEKYPYITNIELEEIKAYQPFSINDVQITPLPLYHEPKNDEKKDDKDIDNTFGFLLEHQERKTIYLSDYYRIPTKVKNIMHTLRKEDNIIADGTYLFTENYDEICMQYMNEDDHLFGEEIINEFKPYKAKIIFTNIIAFNQLKHYQIEKKLKERKSNFTLAYDGMKINQ